MTAPPDRARADDLPWLTIIKAVALTWIFVNHVGERIFGYPFFSNPGQGWPPLEERLRQLLPLDGYGLLTLPVNAFRTLAWTGDQGVQLFLVASGFGLTWSLLRAGRTEIPFAEFLRRRAWRILPLWWGAHLAVLAVGVLGGRFGLDSGVFWRSFCGIRVTAGDFYALSPSWWYIGLLLQLYLLFPFLYRRLLHHGPLRFLGSVLIVSCAARAFGLLTFDGYLDAWSRGAVFITRLPEFAMGMVFALLFHRDREGWSVRLRSPAFLGGAAAVYAVGSLSALSLIGMTVALFLLGAGAFVLLWALFLRRPSLRGIPGAVVQWTGDHSYALFLVHGFAIAALVPVGLDPAAPALPVRILLAAGATVLGAVALETVVGRAHRGITASASRRGPGRTTLTIGTAVLLLLLLPGAGEFAFRAWNPQEVLGWGERPALEPHERYGWRLIPSRTTRLRWESYDYTVDANALGFPGPLYPAERAPGTYRILVTGDAFTSAEGVNTPDSWPRLVEDQLNSGGGAMRTEVLNFAMTGFGPNQYLAVLEDQIPRCRPDLVIVEMFVNEYQDVQTTVEEFRTSIGFHRPPANSLPGILQFPHLTTWIRQKLIHPFIALLRSQPSPPYGYTLGNFTALERDGPVGAPGAVDSVTARLLRMRETARAHGARILVLLVPAPVQVCPPAHLAYFPSGVTLAESSRFDTDLPQRTTQRIADGLGLPWVDLRTALRHDAGACPYQPRNMHWTRAGHQRAADTLVALVRELRTTPTGPGGAE